MVLSVNEHTFKPEVLESPTLVLVSFWAPWCGLCHVIDPLLKRFEAQWPESIKLVRINADENFKLANDYQLISLPMVLLFDQGQLRYRLDGFESHTDIRRSLGQMLEKITRSAPLQARVN